MSALTIMLIRHAEKPHDPDKPHDPEDPTDPNLGVGLTAKGAEDHHSLVIRGWQRAGTWAALFGSGALAADFPRPDTVYAADPTKALPEDTAPSKRPHQTITPLCKRLHITPVTKFAVGDEVKMLDEVSQLTGNVLICWEHKKIAKVIVPKLANGQNLPHLPPKWDGTRFDVVLRFDRAQNAGQWSFRQLFPRLLSGDVDVPVQFPSGATADDTVTD